MDAYKLLSKRNHIHRYKEDKIPPKELIDDLLYKAWKTTPSKNNFMPYHVNVLGPEHVDEKASITKKCMVNKKQINEEKIPKHYSKDHGDKWEEDGSNPSFIHISTAPYVLVFTQRIIGAFVSGMDAGLVYNTFPYMGDGIIPIEYGNLGFIDPFENPVTAQFHHRLLASITLIIIIIYSIHYIIKNPMNLRILLLLFAIVCQFIIGIFTLLYSVPITLGAMHQFGGVLLFLSALWLLHSPKKNTF